MEGDGLQNTNTHACQDLKGVARRGGNRGVSVVNQGLYNKKKKKKKTTTHHTTKKKKKKSKEKKKKKKKKKKKTPQKSTQAGKKESQVTTGFRQCFKGEKE